MDYALTTHRLSDAYKRDLEGILGRAPHYLDFVELRKQGFPGLIRSLRTLRAERLVLPFEYRGTEATLPQLAILAWLASADDAFVLDRALSRRPVTGATALEGLWRIFAASCDGVYDVCRCRSEVRRLARLPRISLSRSPEGRILYLDANLWFGPRVGGSVAHIAGVVNSFLAVGRPVTLASVGEPTMLRGGPPSLAYVALDLPDTFGFPYGSTVYRLQRDAEKQLVARHDHEDLGFIYQRQSIGSYLGVLLSRRWRVPLVIEYNASEVWQENNWGQGLRHETLATAVELLCLRHAHMIVTVSEVLRQQLLDRGVERERIVCYPNGVDPSVFDSARFDRSDDVGPRETHGIKSDALVVAFVGTFGPWHGAEVMARAIQRFVDEGASWIRQHAVHFLFIGEGARLPAVRQMLENGACRSHVTFTGAVPQSMTPRYLAAVDVLVSPHVPNPDGSPFFGSPMKLFEYMAMQKAIVASDLNQIGEVLRPALHSGRLPREGPSEQESARAILCNPGDPESLARAIRFSIEQSAWRTVLGRNARAAVLKHFTWDHHVAAILAGLSRVTDSRPNSSRQ